HRSKVEPGNADQYVLCHLQCQLSCDLILISRNLFLHVQRLVDIKVHILAVAVSDYPVALAFKKKVHCLCSHDGCVHAVLACGTSAALHVAQDRSSCLHACGCLDPLGQLDRASDPLCIDDDIVLLPALSALLDVLDDGEIG